MRHLALCALLSWLTALAPFYVMGGLGDTTGVHPSRSCMLGTAAVGGGLFAGSLILLDRAWYADHPRSALHAFNDGREWLQMDKAGHAFSAYTLGHWSHKALDRCAPGERWPLWVGGGMGLLYLTGIEVLDGTSAEWGFSWWDMAANVTGSSLYIGQELLWSEQRMRLKLSAVPTDYAARRPTLLGETLPERLLKDYNGQTIWLSVNVDLFLPEVGFPKWLNLAFGYGAEGMITAAPEPGDGRVRQFYLSPDMDLTRLPVRKPWLRTVLAVLNSIKVPAPSLEIDGSGRLRGHWMHF